MGKRGREGDGMGRCVVGKGEVEGTREKSVVGGIEGKGLEVEGLIEVGLGHRRGREARREEQRTKI